MGSSPKMLSVLGSDFSSVEEVLINQIPSPDFLVPTNKRLLAQVPDAVLGDRIFTVSVLSRRLTLSRRSFIKFRISDSPGKVKGILRLMQLFLKTLLTTPGVDIFNRKVGGAALRNLGANFGKDEGSNIVSDFIIAVNTTARQVVAIQSRDSSLPRDERLLSAKVLSSGFSKQEGALIITIELVSQAGTPARISLEL